jgi:dolichyl-phosphate beta-glucosyltransferase
MTGYRPADPRGTDRLVSLVLPAYNPGPALDDTLRAIAAFLQQQGPGWEAVFVCDGCTDGTAERLRDWKPRGARVRVVSYSPNRGKGYAVRQGLLAAAGDYRIFTDVDLAYPFDDVLRVADRLRAGDEVVIASRLHPDSKMVLPTSMQGYAYRRHLQSKVFSRLVRLCLPLGQRDTQAGLKGLSARVVRAVVPRLACDGFGFDCELLTACVRHGLPVTEVPVCVRYDRGGSTTNLRATLRMVRELWSIRRRYLSAEWKVPSAESDAEGKAA